MTSIGTTSSKEDTLDKATYPTVGENVFESKAKVICCKSSPIILCTVEEYLENFFRLFQKYCMVFHEFHFPRISVNTE